MEFLDFSGGINWQDPAYKLRANQCVYLQNFRYTDSIIETMPGSIRYHGTSLGSDPVNAIMPYYNPDNADYFLLSAVGDSIYRRYEGTGEFSSLLGALTPNSIHSHAIRNGVMYIPSTVDRMRSYLGGLTLPLVGGGSTVPPQFRHIIYMKEVDRLFGVDEKGNIYWCDLSQPEIWDGANTDRIKLQDGEITEGVGILYGKLIIFCTYSIWIYYVSGNEENWKLEQAPTAVGCAAPNTLRKVGSEYWFLSDSGKTDRGVYAFGGSSAKLLTKDISPLMNLINKEKIRGCAAEYHKDLYTLSFPFGFATQNDRSIDLDVLNFKEDGTPAVYGPHTVAFNCSAVLNTRDKSGEFLMGDYSDGYIYREGGTTLKSTNGADGQLLEQRFLGAIHNDKKWDIMKLYNDLNVYFAPRNYFAAKLRFYLSYSSYEREKPFYPQANVSHIAGDYNIFEDRVLGSPELSQFQLRPGLDSRGVSLQVEIINDVGAQRMAIEGYSFRSEDLYTTRKAEIYAI